MTQVKTGDLIAFASVHCKNSRATSKAEGDFSYLFACVPPNATTVEKAFCYDVPPSKFPDTFTCKDALDNDTYKDFIEPADEKDNCLFLCLPDSFYSFTFPSSVSALPPTITDAGKSSVIKSPSITPTSGAAMDVLPNNIALIFTVLIVLVSIMYRHDH
jgi:hypothetical protein